ncbi:PrsW family intramembrane metalloprotease (plasmid) [Deinococcus taeanensis]|uniref:PrsW family intramembrane metalloprotease n=1 Tax=Deinococcus taeanensis TaxID=2737050 RepID=UPI001CDB7630|nr:PrsW family glutamic-type intramembrane protease [Deinococcus taeanensis]UBV44117.1 PrsW family intramembrane metalloprotease [Deinococcus taeanensis]
MQLLGVPLFVGAATVADHLFGNRLSGGALIAAGVIMALIPAALWLLAFSREDRLEPEPKTLLLGVFVLAALLAQAVGEPLVRLLTGGAHTLLVGLVVSVLVVGMVQEFLKYAAVRYTVFTTAHFDHRVDGVLYGASAGLGYATVLNMQYLLQHSGVDLGVGAIRMAVTALGQASFAGLTGYALGSAKFDRRGPLWLPAAVGGAALLNGAVSLLLRELPWVGGLSFRPEYGLVLAVMVAGATFAFLSARMRRLIAADQRSTAERPVAGGTP